MPGEQGERGDPGEVLDGNPRDSAEGRTQVSNPRVLFKAIFKYVSPRFSRMQDSSKSEAAKARLLERHQEQLRSFWVPKTKVLMDGPEKT